jgi:hypothetical protein
MKLKQQKVEEQKSEEQTNNEHLLCLMIALQIIDSTIAVAEASAWRASSHLRKRHSLHPNSSRCYLQIY